MAIISIPTSIGGVTIPGLNKGPLRSLFGNPFSTTSLQYPSDLTAANKNHFVRFDIREIDSADFSKDITGGKGIFTTEGAKNALDVGVKKITEFTDSVTDTKKTFSQNLEPGVKQTPVATIQLYMPDSMEFQSGINYGEEDLLSATQEVLSTFGGKVGTAIASVGSAMKSSAAQIALKKFGYALNPQVQLLFQNIDFRDYTMSFVFSPNSKEEAQNIQKIIKTFRGWSAPQIVADTKGMFYKPPAVFDVSFWSNGSQNTKINRIQRSVVTSVDVNYAPNGWAAHSDGSPVQTTMTIQLKETVLNDREQILSGGY